MDDTLLVGRNKVMVSRVIQLLRSNPGSSLFFAFNAAHFTGDDSVIDLMREAGFEVERVRVSDDLNTWQSPHSGSERRPSRLLVLTILILLLLSLILSFNICIFLYLYAI